MELSVVILAAGQGTRMKSKLPKVLHKIAGKSMLEHVVNTAETLSALVNPENIHVVYGFQGEQVKQALSHLSVNWVEQKEQLGTGHAVLQVMPNISDDPNHKVLILYGDVPLISKETLEELIQSASKGGVGIITADVDDPAQLGRVVRDHSGNFLRIVEYKDASDVEKKIEEVNSGIYIIPAKYLKSWLPELSNKNTQKEYYLTDILEMAVDNGVSVATVVPNNNTEVMGVNDRVQLAELERSFQELATTQLMLQGVTMLDPTRVDIRGNITVEGDVEIDINVILEGDVILKSGSYIGPNTVIKNAYIGENVQVEANSIIENSRIEKNAHIGPFARIRPECELGENVKIGNFVEVKKSQIAKNSKVSHLSYIGDTIMGENINIGAGTITCNYDGKNKHQTLIENNVFVGSGTQLVAPVTIGEGATIGAGSTITQNASANKLALARARQIEIQDWDKK